MVGAVLVGPLATGTAPHPRWAAGPPGAIPAHLVANVPANPSQQRVGTTGGTSRDRPWIATIGRRTITTRTARAGTTGRGAIAAGATVVRTAVTVGGLAPNDSLTSREASLAGRSSRGCAVANIEQILRR